MFHRIHRSIGQMTLNPGKLTRVLRRGSWKALNLLVVAALLLPNFSILSELAKATSEGTRDAEMTLSARPKDQTVVLKAVHGQVPSVVMKPKEIDLLMMLPTTSDETYGALIYSGELEDATFSVIDGHSFVLHAEWDPGSVTNRNVAIQAIFDGVYDPDDYCYLDYSNQECVNYLDNTGSQLYLSVTALLVSPGAGTIQVYDLDQPLIPKKSTTSSCHPKSGGGDSRECPLASYRDAQGTIADPINTYSGGFDYSIVDLSIPTIAGDLVFQHSYASLVTQTYTTTMGYGWTHNHDTRLIFPDDPLGEEDTVWFKAHTTNQYKFLDNGDGTYDAYPGVLATLDEITDYYEVTDPSQNVYHFYDDDGTNSDLEGLLYQWKTPEGFTYTYAYTDTGTTDGLLEYVYGPTHGQQTQQYLVFSYTNDRLTGVSDYAGRDVSFSYDANGDLTTFTDVMEEDWTYGYDTDASHPDHLLATITDPSSTTILTTTYDTEGRAILQEDALNTLADITYNSDGTTDIENGRGYTSTHTYDIRETLTGESNSAGLDIDKTYDPNFRPEQITVVSNTHLTTLDWSADGANLTEITNAVGDTTDLDYDSLNNLTEFSDPRGYSTNYEYDETLLISSTNALAQTTLYTYTTSADSPAPTGLLKSITTPLGTTVYTYTATGQLSEMRDALGQETTYTYNDWGLLESITDPAGRTIGPATTMPGGCCARWPTPAGAAPAAATTRPVGKWTKTASSLINTMSRAI